MDTVARGAVGAAANRAVRACSQCVHQLSTGNNDAGRICRATSRLTSFERSFLGTECGPSGALFVAAPTAPAVPE